MGSHSPQEATENRQLNTCLPQQAEQWGTGVPISRTLHIRRAQASLPQPKIHTDVKGAHKVMQGAEYGPATRSVAVVIVLC